MLTSSLIALSTILGMAEAHGYSSTPRARQLICKTDDGYWWPEDGSKISNPACKAAFLKSGTTLFTDAHGFSKNVISYNNIDQVQAAIPDGSLCSAGNAATRGGIDIKSPSWQKNSVILDDKNTFKMDIEFCAHAPHSPSFWDVYISKPSYSAAKSTLSWKHLEKIAHFENLELIHGSAQNCDAGQYYKLEGVQYTIPRGQADAVMYIRWQRQDPAGEGFYNCIDLSFDNAEYQASLVGHHNHGDQPHQHDDAL